ncbi:hypothetical protein F511_32049 [Dorcoceras hygrometricum]|uniref:Uncharacterized protein n=1 Tax=Dorcoceras hygrometricum TaxID=472368 RepID=A0A2Z7CMB6_9LAMI|nr:hypothetical protein F511_32049 [Dorcoceras hygrometricum]
MSTLSHTFFIALSMIFTLTLAMGSAELSPGDSRSSPAMSFYDVLKSNGLPMGIFPKGISDFYLDPDSGRFELHMLPPSPCDAKFETRVRYTFNISGFVNYGRIANLSGVAAQELFLWLPVKGIQVDVPSSGLIYFDVGMVFKQFSLSFFEEPKDCNAVEEGDGRGNEVFFFNDHGRIAEHASGNLWRKPFADEERMADS